jgi:hypothetical protein
MLRSHELNEAMRADLRRITRERLRFWLKTSMDLYDMAEISKLHAVEDILFVLLNFTMNGVSALEIDPKSAAKLFEEILTSMAEQAAEKKSRKSTKEEST